MRHWVLYFSIKARKVVITWFFFLMSLNYSFYDDVELVYPCIKLENKLLILNYQMCMWKWWYNLCMVIPLYCTLLYLQLYLFMKVWPQRDEILFFLWCQVCYVYICSVSACVLGIKKKCCKRRYICKSFISSFYIFSHFPRFSHF